MQIEIKVNISDVNSVRETIKKLDARFWKTTKEKDIYFPSRKGVLKIKESEGECLLIHDFRPKESKTTALRTELPLDKIFAEKITTILDDSIGTKLILSKTREQYIYHGNLLAIDAIENHETFLELTSDEVPEEKMHEEKEKLLTLLKTFGYDEKDLETTSYIDLYTK